MENRRHYPEETEQALRERLFAECEYARGELDKLSPRQIEVAVHIAKGFNFAEVGEMLGISKNGVNAHVWRALTILEIKSRVELSVLVAKAGLA